MTTPAEDGEQAVATEQPKKFDKVFYRQTVMIEEVKKFQLECQHSPKLITPNVLTCTECGAMWIK
jgi:hypothetical protein